MFVCTCRWLEYLMGYSSRMIVWRSITITGGEMAGVCLHVTVLDSELERCSERKSTLCACPLPAITSTTSGIHTVNPSGFRRGPEPSAIRNGPFPSAVAWLLGHKP